MTIVEFLEARIAEDEAVAREAQGAHWEWEHGYGEMCDDPECPYGSLMARSDEGLTQLMDVHGFDVHEGWEGGPHIVRHDPARVLAECAAKRHILYTLRSYEPDTEWDTEPDMGKRGNNLAGAVRRLAAVYKDHPDYQQEWTAVEAASARVGDCGDIGN